MNSTTTWTERQITDARGALNMAVGKLVDATIARAQDDDAKCVAITRNVQPYLAHASRVLGTTLGEVNAAVDAALITRRRLCPAVDALFAEPMPEGPCYECGTMTSDTRAEVFMCESCAITAELAAADAYAEYLFDQELALDCAVWDLQHPTISNNDMVTVPSTTSPDGAQYPRSLVEAINAAMRDCGRTPIATSR